FLQGENKFALVKTSGAQSTPVSSGAESGDWAALTGATGGFLFGTREAARRHPKEFLATASTLNVLLFSPKGGSELDFRSPQAIKDIGIAELTKIVDPRVNTDATIKKLSAFAADARGWAKTHELVLAPIAAGQSAAEYAKPAALMSQPAHALASPQWLYET